MAVSYIIIDSGNNIYACMRDPGAVRTPVINTVRPSDRTDIVEGPIRINDETFYLLMRDGIENFVWNPASRRVERKAT